MNEQKQRNKLKKLMQSAEDCTDRKKAQKIIKKSTKVQRKLGKAVSNDP